MVKGECGCISFAVQKFCERDEDELGPAERFSLPSEERVGHF